MLKRKNPSTSNDAYDHAKRGLIKTHHQKILNAMAVIGSCTAEKLADYLGAEHVAINRRFKELREAGKIYNTFEKLPTRKGRMAYVHSLCAGEKVEKKPERALPGKSVADYSKEITQLSLL